MALGDPGKWRKSKVDSFIRRHLAKMDLGVARYYEMCMWESKGNLLPSYALLLDNCLVLTENPPKSVIQSIPLRHIKDISLVADRHSLIKSKNSALICQHVAVAFHPGKVAKKAAVLVEGGEGNQDIHSDEEDTSNSSGDGGSSELSVSPVPSTVALDRGPPVPEEILHCYEPSITIERRKRSPLSSSCSHEKVRTWPRKERGKQDKAQQIRAHWWNRRTNERKRPKEAMNGSGGPEKVETIELYFYQKDSEFVNELSLVWNRQQMVGGLSPTLWGSKSRRAAERILVRLKRDWEFEGHTSLQNKESLRKVFFLHKCLRRYEHLKYLCWKNTVIMTGLIDLMPDSLEPCSGQDEENIPPRETMKGVTFWETGSIQNVAVYALLMDTFRTLFGACSVVWFKDESGSPPSCNEGEAWDQNLTIFNITKKLIRNILKCHFLPRDSRNGSYLTVTDPQKFIKASWLRYDDENLSRAKLICTAHNASVALLFELLAIAHFLPTSVQNSLVVCDLHELNLEDYVRLSVTQIIYILWNFREPFNPAQTMTLYRQVWNLLRLGSYDRSIFFFIRANFCEEFHYYATTKGIQTLIPDQFVIKPKVIYACDLLLKEIVGNRSTSRLS